jgi:hypothetical protein
MHCYWGLGVGHTYAHGTRDSVDINLNANALGVDDVDDGELAGRHEALSTTAAQESALTGDIGAELNPGSPAVPSISLDSDFAASELEEDSVTGEPDFEEEDSE